jgi:hypothetical protein
MAKLIGYARVSTRHQSTDRQEADLSGYFRPDNPAFATTLPIVGPYSEAGGELYGSIDDVEILDSNGVALPISAITRSTFGKVGMVSIRSIYMVKIWSLRTAVRRRWQNFLLAAAPSNSATTLAHSTPSGLGLSVNRGKRSAADRVSTRPTAFELRIRPEEVIWQARSDVHSIAILHDARAPVDLTCAHEGGPFSTEGNEDRGHDPPIIRIRRQHHVDSGGRQQTGLCSGVASAQRRRYSPRIGRSNDV